MPKIKNQIAKVQTKNGKYEVLFVTDSKFNEYIQVRKNRVKIANYTNTYLNQLRAVKIMLNEAEYDLIGCLDF